MLWRRDQDTFEVGQWLHGRIYERRCDLSPRGTHWIYFAMSGNTSYTALARAPYLRAIGFMPKGDCWHGGGLFTGTSSYWLNDGYGHTVQRSTSELQRDTAWRPAQAWGGECPGVYYPRLLRDGWSLVRSEERGRASVDVFERSLLRGYRLRKLAHAGPARVNRGCYWDEHVLIDPDGIEHTHADWEWADLDGARLVYASAGRLFARGLDARALTRELFDFGHLAFARIRAPYA